MVETDLYLPKALEVRSIIKDGNLSTAHAWQGWQLCMPKECTVYLSYEVICLRNVYLSYEVR